MAAIYRVTNTQRFQSKQGRYVGIVFVIVLHIVIIYALVTALQRGTVEVLRGPVEVSEIKEQKPQQKETPPPPPDFKPPPPPYVPPPDINVATTSAPAPSITATTQKAPPAPPPPPPAPTEVVTVPPKALRKVEVTEQDYPPIESRLGHEGVVSLEFKVGLDGKPTEIHVTKSSGYPRLDTKAVELLEAKGQFQPGTVDGKPTVVTTHINIRFQLNE